MQRVHWSMLGSLAVGMLVACGSSSSAPPPDASPDASGDAADVGVHDSGPDTAANATLSFALHRRVAGVATPLPGVSVTCDRPEGSRQEAPTDAAGTVVFGGFDWSAGTASCTAYAAGYALHSVVGLSTGGSYTIELSPLDGSTIELTGQARNRPGGAPGLWVTSSSHRSSFEQDASDYVLRAAAARPFVLLAAATKTDVPPSSRELRRPILGWASSSHGGSSADVTVDVDFAQPLTPTTFKATLALPAGSGALATSSHAEVHTSVLEAPTLLTGAATSSTLGSGEFALDGQYVTVPSFTRPITRYSLTLDDGAGSHRWYVGAPQAGLRVDGWLPLPEIVAPSDPQQPVPPQGNITWAAIDSAIVPSLELRRDGELLWRIEAPAGASSLTLPLPPDALDTTAFFGAAPLDGQALFCTDFDSTSGLCRRTSTSAPFLVQASPPDTVTVTGTLTDFATQQPLAGAQVCVPEQPSVPCATSSGQGTFSLAGVPNLGKVVSIDVIKNGYVAASLARGEQQLDNHYVFAMFPTNTLSTLGTKLGVAVDTNQGLFLIEAPEGTSVTLSPKAGVGPGYADTSGYPAAGQTSMGTRGWAWLANVPPGVYDAKATKTGTSCTVQHGWAGPTADTARVQASAETLFVTRFACK